MRTRIAGAVLAATLALAGVGVGGVPAGAATEGHAVTVTPATGLADGQTVTVAGTGFVETPIVNDWAVAQCSAAILTAAPSLDDALADCDVTSQPFVFAHADPAGNLSTSVAVRKSFSTSSGTAVTCGQGADSCAILVGQLTTGGIFVGAATAISFGSPHRAVADCFRDFAQDHTHRVGVRAVRLLRCVLRALADRSH